jgi:hypothetical protein
VRKSVAILILGVLLLQYSSKVGVVVYYHLHYEYILAHLCENRENVFSRCEGQCFLAKKMQLQKEKSSVLERLYTEVVGEKNTGFGYYLYALSIYKIDAHSPYIPHDTMYWQSEIFRPPELLFYS